MFREIEIENFKSIEKLKLSLGRVTVLIGENGCGKSNLLEAIAFAGAAARGAVEHEFLYSRGIRVTAPEFMRSALAEGGGREEIRLGVKGDQEDLLEWRLKLRSDALSPQWEVSFGDQKFSANVVARISLLHEWLSGGKASKDFESQVKDLIETLALDGSLAGVLKRPATFETIRNFLIFTPENTALRKFDDEAQILPLGVKGEGLFLHLQALSQSKTYAPLLTQIADHLSLIDWFSGLDIPSDLAPYERTLRIRDRFLAEGKRFDQRSANEGFLFLLFYFTLLLSPETPPFFAIDNVEASLNPKLCAALTEQIVTLAKANDRQVILTTHNPAILDGLNLHDDEQRLLVVYRGSRGETRVRRVPPPKAVAGEVPSMKL